MTADRPRLLASPTSALVDAAVDMRVTGCRPRAAVTVRARVDDPLRGCWSSGAVFEANDAGAVDLASARPVAGGYATVDPFGLLWSLERDPATAPLVGFAGPSGLRGRAMALGGTPAGNAAAAADSWPRILQFLRTGLAAR
jgi:hypothetical protein